MPIYVPQFKEPTLQMIEQTMKYLGLKKSYYLDLPEWKTKTLEPVAVGYLYYKKLEQQASYKQSVRSTGRYNQSTGQATQGKSAGGGQKVGEMDTWCLISHGVEKTLREIMGGLSDDMTTKNEMISDIINNGYADYKEPKSSPSTERLKVYLTGTMIQTDI
jgi:DNA-directed RNA polymerase beta subunit